jgi:hypothetical protein
MRPAIKLRPAPSAHPHPDTFAGVIKDITSGTKELARQGQAATQNIKSGYQKIKKFTSK